MKIDLSGEWRLSMEQDEYEADMPEPAAGALTLPGSLQAAGYGYPVHEKTEWVSGLHNPFWQEREEYRYRPEYGEDIYRVPFLAQPARHFTGKAWYSREFLIPGDSALRMEADTARGSGAFGDTEWTLFIESAHWRSSVYIDNVYVGGDCSLCAPHEIPCGRLAAGAHQIEICIDNSMQYAYRPDGHGVSDALGATWNGMVGEIALLSGGEAERREKARRDYAKAHPRSARSENGRFIIDGRPEYFRGTHFGGDYPLTGYPEMTRGWWDKLMETVKSWGFNFIRCHSYCPPEAAFQAADEAGIYLQPECGMWNIFNPGEEEMMEVLKAETVRILRHFGHHPSFALFSPSNEPGGEWYQPLKEWVRFARKTDEQLGYGGRRLYTAESGWFYDAPPKEIGREDTDYLYFHRSAYGPIRGGNIRNYEGWKGKDYNPSLEGARLPVICHEMGQWCAYPDFDKLIPKFTGFLRPGNLELFRENARARGLLPFAKDFAYCSGRNQLRMVKEDVEANFRTEHLYGFELLDLHDYMGQGAALVGILDAFWEEKGAVSPEEFREFCGETVLLARLPAYVYKSGDVLEAPVEVSHFGREDLSEARVVWRLRDVAESRVCREGSLGADGIDRIPCGGNTPVGKVSERLINGRYALELELTAGNLPGKVCNHWEIFVYDGEAAPGGGSAKVLDTHDFALAKQALAEGRTVIFRPLMSDMDYDCPPLSIRNSFWNNQMGPKWGRGLGLSVQESHPIFQEFPTDHDGGWQWEEILDYARGFGLRDYPDFVPLVRVIDEWNRNLPMGILLEADVLEGRLLLVSVDLEANLERRPAAAALNRAILRYAERGNYREAARLPIEAVEDRIFPLNRSREIVRDIRFGVGTIFMARHDSEKGGSGEERKVREALLDANPNNAAGVAAEQFPIEITFLLKHSTAVRGIYYMPPQKDRMFEGCVRDYEVEALTEDAGWRKIGTGTFENSLFAQKAVFRDETRGETMASAVRVRVLSCYGQGEKTVWDEAGDGWHRERRILQPQAWFAAFHIICDGECEHDNRRFWREHAGSGTREIEN